MNANPPNSARLLMYGQDTTLLETRRLVLETAGFSVHATWALPNIQAELATDADFGLLIVCHTASSGDRRALAALAEKASVPVYQIEKLIAPADLIAHVSARR